MLIRSGATYDSIEGRFRIVRKDAVALKKEVDSGARPSAPPRGSSNTVNGASSTNSVRANKNTTPRKQGRGGAIVARGGSNSITPTPGPASAKKEKIISGRITKSSTTSPTKANGHRTSLALDTDGTWEMDNTVATGILTPTSLGANMKQESMSSHSSAAASVYDEVQDAGQTDVQAALMIGMDGGPGGWDSMASFGGWSTGMHGYGAADGSFPMEDGV